MVRDQARLFVGAQLVAKCFKCTKGLLVEQRRKVSRSDFFVSLVIPFILGKPQVKPTSLLCFSVDFLFYIDQGQVSSCLPLFIAIELVPFSQCLFPRGHALINAEQIHFGHLNFSLYLSKRMDRKIFSRFFAQLDLTPNTTCF